MIDNLLNRLDGVKSVKDGYIAKCPAHDDKRPSLSLCEKDGRVLLHCFAGCTPADVLAAVGLSFADLFPERLKPQTPTERRHVRNQVRHANRLGAMRVVNSEAIIIRIAADDTAAGITLDDEDRVRLALAHDRISAAQQVLS